MRKFRKAAGALVAGGGAWMGAAHQAMADTSGYTYTNTPYYVDNNGTTAGAAGSNASAQLTWNSNAAIWDPAEDGTGTSYPYNNATSGPGGVTLNSLNPDTVFGAGYSNTNNTTGAVSPNLLNAGYTMIISGALQTEGIYIKDGAPSLSSGNTVGARTIGADGITLEATATSVAFPIGGGTGLGNYPLNIAANQTWTNNNTASTGFFTEGVPVTGAATTGTFTLTLANHNTSSSTSTSNLMLLGGVISDGTSGGNLALTVASSAGTYVNLTPMSYSGGVKTNGLIATSNTYSGGTTILSGILDAGAGGGTNGSGSLGTGNVLVGPDSAVAAELEMDAPAMLSTQSLTLTDDGSALATAYLNYTGTDTINTLTYDGTELTPGVYGSGGTPESFLSGTGSLTVVSGTTVPEPASLGLLGLGALSLLRRRKN